ncbi:MAG: methyl-accepting chemotaxis signaling domain protein [Hyphomicrobiales bacterium]|nr:methyl-accepting chemotaxis signaling domain protein [Hyphomicrobiales bacterium]
MSIRFKLLCGFGFLVMLAAAIAYVAVERTNELGRMVVEVYDRPLMSINHARRAETGFNKALSVFARDSQRPDAAAAAAGQIVSLLNEVESDLGVVSERFAMPAVVASLSAANSSITDWKTVSLAALTPGESALSLPTRWTIDQKAAAVADALDDLVQNVAGSGFDFRIQAERRLRESEQVFFRLAGSAAGLGLLLSLLYARMIAHPIRRLALALASIKDGGAQVDIPGLKRRDEVGAVARGVQLISGVANENQLTVAAVNSSDTMMMIADAAGQIVFISETLHRLLKRLEPSLAAGSSGFSAAGLRGAQLAQFEANPRLRRAVILEAGGVRKLRYDFEGATILVHASRVLDSSGAMLGETLLWRDVTDDLTGETEVADLVAATQAGDFSKRLSLANKAGFIKDLAAGLN